MMGTGEILVILVIILILFGGKRLPEFAQSLGKGIREFKKACQGEEEASSTKESESDRNSPAISHNTSHDSSKDPSKE